MKPVWPPHLVVGESMARAAGGRAGCCGEPLQQHMAAEGGADGDAARGWLASRQQPRHEVEVAGLAGVVEARPAVHEHAAALIERAGAEIDRRRGETVARDRGEEALHVYRVRAPLEAMQEEKADRRVAVEMIEHELVAVRRLDRLAPQLRQPPRPHDAAPDRL